MIPMLPAAPRTSTDSPGSKRAWVRPKWATTPELPNVIASTADSDYGVDTADADRLGGDQHLPVGGTWFREGDDGEAFWTSERLDRNCLHCRLLVRGLIVEDRFGR